MDIHDPFTTVREGLAFAAKLVCTMPLCVLREESCPGVELEDLFCSAPTPFMDTIHQRMQAMRTEEEIAAAVSRIIALLDLEEVADSLVGALPGGLSVGERTCPVFSTPIPSFRRRGTFLRRLLKCV